MDHELNDLFTDYSRMGKAAEKALLAKTRRTMQKYAEELFMLARECSAAVIDLEGTDHPFTLASLVITTIVEDDRPFFEVSDESINPNDSYSIYLGELLVNVPDVLGHLAHKQQQLDSSSSV